MSMIIFNHMGHVIFHVKKYMIVSNHICPSGLLLVGSNLLLSQVCEYGWGLESPKNNLEWEKYCCKVTCQLWLKLL